MIKQDKTHVLVQHKSSLAEGGFCTSKFLAEVGTVQPGWMCIWIRTIKELSAVRGIDKDMHSSICYASTPTLSVDTT